jgi:hypothetical protein
MCLHTQVTIFCRSTEVTLRFVYAPVFHWIRKTYTKIGSTAGEALTFLQSMPSLFANLPPTPCTLLFAVFRAQSSLAELNFGIRGIVLCNLGGSSIGEVQHDQAKVSREKGKWKTEQKSMHTSHFQISNIGLGGRGGGKRRR